jgi:putative transposase
MPNYRRWYVPGATYFFTVVTHERRHILTSSLARKCLRDAIRRAQAKTPFESVAVVLLPDHLHTIWTLPPAHTDYSGRWGQIKEAFTRAYLKAGGDEASRTLSRVRKRGRGVWQHRFWEHVVRDENDLSRCLDYIHWNPVKHGLVTRVADYPWSSFHQFVKAGEYTTEWGRGEVADIPGAEWE